MLRHWKNLKYLLRHKWFVLKAGLYLRAPLWNLIIHDWSKFLPSEWFAYTNHFFYSDKAERFHIPKPHETEFNYAWLYHQRRNKHHWQYWVLQFDANDSWRICAHQPECGPWILTCDKQPLYIVGQDPNNPMNTVSFQQMKDIVQLLNLKPVALEMPMKYVLEMVADWIGAGAALGFNDPMKWYQQNKHQMILHDNTTIVVEALLTKYMNK